MKRVNDIFDKICTIDNVNLADDNARKGKCKQYGVVKHDKNRLIENEILVEELYNLAYKTSKYRTSKIYEPKERLLYKLPYYPDRITHHAIMNILEPIWTKIFIKHTYSCLKGRGIHKLNKDLKSALKDIEGTTYCLKLDIKKFYPLLIMKF